MNARREEEVKIIQDATAAGIDVSALIAAAIKAKLSQIKELPKVQGLEVLAIPESEQLKWWETTREEVGKINGGDREALEAFFVRNYWRIECSARNYIRKNATLKSVVGHEDLINQYYIDLATGLLKFGPWDKSIRRAMYHSFRYAPVGGIDELYDVSYGESVTDAESKFAELWTQETGKRADYVIKNHDRSGGTEACQRQRN